MIMSAITINLVELKKGKLALVQRFLTVLPKRKKANLNGLAFPFTPSSSQEPE
jgi:hypothetical protein